jgi:DNA-directed RNA polymerase specialized sigma24 family protein
MSAGQFQQRLREILPRAGAVAMAIVGNRADAEDMVQEAALRACRAIDS